MGGQGPIAQIAGTKPKSAYAEFVDYGKLDPVKREALDLFGPTLRNPERLGVRIIPETLGESAIAIALDGASYHLAFNVEGLGTKVLIADVMHADPRGGKLSYFEGVGVDNVAMSTNDLASIGGDPIVYGDLISTHNSDWFEGDGKTGALFRGFRNAADRLGMGIPCGETPSLKGIIIPGTLDLAGASVGLINPKSNLTVGQNLAEGDVMVGMASSGMHANGASLARKVAGELPDGYFTQLPSGKLFGEELLVPTTLYTRPLIEMLGSTPISYLQPITGHAWKKIMRNRKPFTYEVEFVPEVPELFRFLQEKSKVPDAEAFATWNMGVGYVAMMPRASVDTAIGISEKHGIKAFELGSVKRGEKAVKIKPKDIVYQDD